MGKHLGLQWFLKHFILSYLNTERVEYFFRLLSMGAVCLESVIISFIPGECTVSPVWPDLAPPLSKRALNTKVVMLWRVSLLSQWEFDLLRGRKRKPSKGNEALFWLLLLQSISSKQSQRGIEQVRQHDQYTHFHTKHVEYVWTRSPMQHLFPSLCPCWMIRFLPYPGTSPIFFIHDLIWNWDMCITVWKAAVWTPTLLLHSLTVAEASHVDETRPKIESCFTTFHLLFI